MEVGSPKPVGASNSPEEPNFYAASDSDAWPFKVFSRLQGYILRVLFIGLVLCETGTGGPLGAPSRFACFPANIQHAERTALHWLTMKARIHL